MGRQNRLVGFVSMKPVNCCVPLCTNNFRNSTNLCFYRIPKDITTAEEICGVDTKQKFKAEV